METVPDSGIKWKPTMEPVASTSLAKRRAFSLFSASTAERPSCECEEALSPPWLWLENDAISLKNPFLFVLNKGANPNCPIASGLRLDNPPVFRDGSQRSWRDISRDSMEGIESERATAKSSRGGKESWSFVEKGKQDVYKGRSLWLCECDKKNTPEREQLAHKWTEILAWSDPEKSALTHNESGVWLLLTGSLTNSGLPRQHVSR